MKVRRERYQHGSVRKVSRSRGFAWEFRFYFTAPNGKRKLKVQTFDSVKYPTERDVRKAVEGQLGALNAGTLGGRVGATVGTLIDRYLIEELPTLRHSTQSTNLSLIKLHIEPQWEDIRIGEVSAIAVKNWLDKLPFGAASKARTRNMMSRLLDLAMLWEYLPVGRNPMELVRVKGATKRQKHLVILTPAQVKSLVDALPEPYNLMVLVSGYLGLRVSETLGLKWADFDFKELSFNVRQIFTHSRVQELPKTDASGEELPIPAKLLKILRKWKAKQDKEVEGDWVFPSPVTGHPYSDSTILTNYLKPTAEELGITGLGWHTLRHSYKSWLADAKVDPAKMKDLMRHADISTTMNVYGKTLTSEMRLANALVAGKLL
jgi:integrase